MLYGWSFHSTLAGCLLTTLEVLVERFMALLGRKSLGADMEGSPRKIPLRWRAGTKSQQDLGFMFIQPASLLAFCIYMCMLYIYTVYICLYMWCLNTDTILGIWDDLTIEHTIKYYKILVFFMGMMGTIRLSRCLIFQWPSLQLSSSFIWRWDVTFLQLTMIEVVSPSDTVIPWYPITRHFLARPMALRGSMISSVSFLGPVQSTSASMMSIKALGWSFMAWWFTTLTFHPLLAKWIPVTIIRIHHFKRGPHATKSQVFQIGEIFWIRMGNYNLPQETIHKPCLRQNVGVGFAPRFLEPKKTLIISLAEKKNRRWSGA